MDQPTPKSLQLPNPINLPPNKKLSFLEWCNSKGTTKADLDEMTPGEYQDRWQSYTSYLKRYGFVSMSAWVR
jgi:hypothetical protein